jgi:hypothetical protein
MTLVFESAKKIPKLTLPYWKIQFCKCIGIKSINVPICIKTVWL